MKPYVDKSLNEHDKPEYSIHGIDESTLCDIIVATNLLRHMLKHKLKLESFNGTDLNNNPELRETKLFNLILKAKKTLNYEKH